MAAAANDGVATKESKAFADKQDVDAVRRLVDAQLNYTRLLCSTTARGLKGAEKELITARRNLLRMMLGRWPTDDELEESAAK